MGSQLSLAVSTTMLIATLVYYYRMVLLTELTTEATLFNTLYAEYATPQMMDAIRSVEDFSHSLKVTETQIVCKKQGEQLWAKSFDHDWQRLLHWYQKLVYFHRLGLLSDRFYQEFPGPIRARHFVDHVEPFAVNSCKLYQDQNCSETFDYLRKLYGLPRRAEIVCEGEASTKKADATKEEL
ncbi:hypothetical protein Poli38472_005921 [Pythium oligandrum]|uniref:Uncharacterized protein n=1 Tax=Pythium oligandrum TaxID=41045 RepID=A0A8K1CUF3_PYTOL|nr:hypothetical protein Poli38472_005921 [Pythium oligandrum]|eukprot:TMW68453.1 hypothetical protein Poli38472_005921 [Pythium oligandrum]